MKMTFQPRLSHRKLKCRKMDWSIFSKCSFHRLGFNDSNFFAFFGVKELNSYTMFIPKKIDVIDPAQLRPISIASNLLRQFHKILVGKLSLKIKLSDYQFGFRPLDGVARGIDLFDAILRSVQVDYKQVSLAVLDLEKAFDSINHEAIFETLDRLELPDGLRAYLHFVYTSSKTQLSFKNSKSSFFHPVKGVRQGDPLSPLLFLMVFNTVIDKLPTDLGFRFNPFATGAFYEMFITLLPVLKNRSSCLFKSGECCD